VTITARAPNRDTASAGRLLGALAVSTILLGAFVYLVYGAGLAQSAVAIGGVVLLLVLALGVAWAANRGERR
jgi:hypothetical protein